MATLVRQTIAFLSVMVLAPALGRADCREDFRKIQVEQEVLLRSFLCSSAGGAEIKVEFYRFSDGAMSLLVAKGSSRLLEQTIGRPKVVENELFRVYADLLNRVGMAHALGGGNYWSLRFGVTAAGGGGQVDGISDATTRANLKVLVGDSQERLPYPAFEEITALRRKIIPPALNFYYAPLCTGSDNTGKCTKFDLTAAPTIQFWRGMRAADVAEYARNRRDYNGLLRRLGKFHATPENTREVAPNELRLVQLLAGSDWPEDFIVMTGSYYTDGCASGEAGGWQFDYTPRAILVDAIRIENASSRSVRIDDLLGSHSRETRLRAAPASSAPVTAGGSSLGTKPETLAPGQTLLIPLRIAFPVPPAPITTRDLSSQLYRRLGASGFGGNVAAHALPAPRPYVYGPEISVSALVVDGQRIDLLRRSSNFIDVAVSPEGGSCPFLLTWDRTDGDWIDHGKVLHRAPDPAREYTEARVFPGFQARFRLEEREPEVALIDQAELLVTLRSGATLALATDHPRLAARDRDYLQLMWGEAVEFAFTLPEGIAEQDVVQSQLAVTGYYQRYSTLLAHRNDARPFALARKVSTTRATTPWVRSNCSRPDATFSRAMGGL
jgi:hypothetical protein